MLSFKSISNVCDSPAETCLALIFEIFVGIFLFILSPRPNCPYLLSPNIYTLSARSIITVCNLPAETCLAFKFAIWVGLFLSSKSPRPRCAPVPGLTRIIKSE
jgi:hypothetical protein